MEHRDKFSMHSIVATWAPKQCALTSLPRATYFLHTEYWRGSFYYMDAGFGRQIPRRWCKQHLDRLTQSLCIEYSVRGSKWDLMLFRYSKYNHQSLQIDPTLEYSAQLKGSSIYSGPTDRRRSSSTMYCQMWTCMAIRNMQSDSSQG